MCKVIYFITENLNVKVQLDTTFVVSLFFYFDGFFFFFYKRMQFSELFVITYHYLLFFKTNLPLPFPTVLSGITLWRCRFILHKSCMKADAPFKYITFECFGHESFVRVSDRRRQLQLSVNNLCKSTRRQPNGSHKHYKLFQQHPATEQPQN